MDVSAGAVLFDLDGTLVETLPDLHRATCELLAEAGLPPLSREEVRRMIGDGARVLVQRAFARAGRPPAEEELDRLYARFLELYERDPVGESHVIAGIPEALAGLRAMGLKLAVCTNKPQRASCAILEAFGLLSHFELVLGGDILPRRKPDPLPLLYALEQLGVSPRRAVMVGDSRIDRLAARAAGMPCVLRSFGYGEVEPAELEPELLVEDMRELPRAIGTLLGSRVEGEV